MALTFLKKLFGLGETSSSQTAPNSPKGQEAGRKKERATGAESQPDLESFVGFVVRALVDSPDQVGIETVNRGRDATIQVTCDKADVGKVIGRNGKTIAAIRALANGAGARAGQRVGVEILD
ncbi:MAG: KH domain-containing protein [Lentisphaerae bacterium]|jgi:uncharacterized protein|nr:KH domain-containing protein [Lentisphaerota bacterium]MBT4819618.1 KH domain-containing protein [Lentisphaerota bacterium]MBT5607280.1 KH domain-containing protein [Lentisphaerota bacterium]MBT7058791.1 KH domain-containing protein [Lentisphaerota bacterium]MBT7842399.1 KH domain-containing protein [Lentisphaerota bacterium]